MFGFFWAIDCDIPEKLPFTSSVLAFSYKSTSQDRVNVLCECCQIASHGANRIVP